MIHKFKLGGFNALLDVNSGGVHIIDDLTYDLLDNVEPPFEEKCPEDVVRKLSKMYDSKDIEDCYEEIVSLYNDKILFSEDDYEKYALSAVASPIKAMCLHIAHDCNLRCKYCFGDLHYFIESSSFCNSIMWFLQAVISPVYLLNHSTSISLGSSCKRIA